MNEDTSDRDEDEVRGPRWVHAVNLGSRRAGAEKLLLALWTWKRWGTKCVTWVYPSIKALAALEGRSVSTIEGRIKILTQTRWIRRENRVVDGRLRVGWLLAWRKPGCFDLPASGSTAGRGSEWTTPDGGSKISSTPGGGSDPPPAVVAPTPDGGSGPLSGVDDQEKIKKSNNLTVDQARTRSTPDGGSKVDPEILRVVQSHPVSWREAMSSTGSWCEDLAKAIPRLGLTPEAISWLLNEWASQRDERQQLGTFHEDVNAGRFPPLRGLWWERRRERQWVETQLGRYERKLAPARPMPKAADPAQLRDSDAIDELRRKLRGET